jgi:hypothetical protein
MVEWFWFTGCLEEEEKRGLEESFSTRSGYD